MKKAKAWASLLIIPLLFFILIVGCNTINSSEYECNEINGGICIDKYNNTTATHVTIPREIDGKEVIIIGQSAFQGCDNLKSINIPSTVKYISGGAFSFCNNLTELNIPETVTEIEKSIIMGSNIKSITIPSTEILPENKFEYLFDYSLNSGYSVPKSLKEVIITGGEKIHDSAFESCKHITTITIPAGVKKIGGYAFYHCESLETINFLGTKKQWNEIEKGRAAFRVYWDEPSHLTIHCTDGTIIMDNKWK